MVDGVKILVRFLPFLEWRPTVPVQFSAPVNLATGEFVGRRHKNNPNNITYTHTGTWRGYRLKVLETHYCNNGTTGRIIFNLIIEGSLHKGFEGGKNDSQFTSQNLKLEVRHLCDSLLLNPHDCQILNLEVGVNIETPFPVSRFINNCVLFHSTIPFASYLPDKSGLVIGRVAKHAQFSIKCYDKGLQYGLGYPLMRFEVRCIKMQYLKKYAIETLADLVDIDKLRKLSEVVITAWDNVLICDSGIDPIKLSISPKERELLILGCNRDFWERLHAANRGSFNKQRTKFRALTSRYSLQNNHSLIRELITSELAELLKPGTFLPGVKHPVEEEGGNIFIAWVMGMIVPNPQEDLSINETNETAQPLETENNQTIISHIQSDAPEATSTQPFQPTNQLDDMVNRWSEEQEPTGTLDLNTSTSLKDTETLSAVQNNSYQPNEPGTSETSDGHPGQHCHLPIGPCTGESWGQAKIESPPTSPLGSHVGTNRIGHSTHVNGVQSEINPSEQVRVQEGIFFVDGNPPVPATSIKIPTAGKMSVLKRLTAGILRAIRHWWRPP